MPVNQRISFSLEYIQIEYTSKFDDIFVFLYVFIDIFILNFVLYDTDMNKLNGTDFLYGNVRTSKMEQPLIY